MKTTKDNLYRIILEEYLKEGGLQISESKVDDLIAHIKGGPRPDWMGDDERKIPPPPAVPRPEEKDDGDTYPMDIPHDNAPESEYSGFQNDSGPGIEGQLAALIQGMPPEEVADLFQAVFEKIPGVEMGDAEEEEEEPGTPYGGKEFDIRKGQGQKAGFELQELMSLIKEVMNEGEWHDITAGETAPLHNTGAVEPQGIVQRIESAYHELQDAFGELPDEIAQEMARKIISDLETLMDTTEYPEDYRE
jgi:hypothetical protein